MPPGPLLLTLYLLLGDSTSGDTPDAPKRKSILEDFDGVTSAILP